MASFNENSRQNDRNVRFKRPDMDRPPSISETTKLQKVVERLTSGLRHYIRSFARIRFVRFSQPVGPDPQDSSGFHNRDGVVQFYDALLNVFRDTDNDTLTDSIFADDGRLIDEDERDFCVYSEQSGKWHPLNPARIRHAVTCYDYDGSYPGEASGANKFPVKFVRINYTEEAGYEDWSPEIIPPDNEDDPHDYVLNLWEGDGIDSTPYVPHETVIWLYHVAGKDSKRGQWYTLVCCPFTEKSSSSVSASGSSESLVSASSASTSSGGSSASNSSASSVSNSSASESSSVSVSESSASSSASSESSGGSSASSSASSVSEISSGGSSVSESSISVSASSSADCVLGLGGVLWEDIPIVAAEFAAYALGIDDEGCLIRIPIGPCEEESSASS